MENLTEQQKAAILYHVFAGCKDKDILFRIAEGDERYNRLKDSSKRQTVYLWYNSEKIQNGIKEITYQIERQKKEIEEKIKQNLLSCKTEAGEGQQKKLNKESVNFLNPDEFLKFANDQANEIQDEKERREYLKMIANLMNYKEGDQEQTDIQRFYTPVICSDCSIYQKCRSCKTDTCPKML